MPPAFTNSEYADMVYVYGYCDGNSRAAETEYAERFPQRRTPNRAVFSEAFRRLRENGSFAQAPRAMGIFAALVDDHRTEEVLDHFDTDPETSTRRAAAELGIPRMTVWRTLKADGRYPYHKQKTQELLPEDYPKRIQYCEWLLLQQAEDPRFTNKILWTDEATFTRKGIFNSRNYHVWAHENPHAIHVSSYQHEFSLNVWLGILDNRLIGPLFLPARLNADGFLNLLNNEFNPLLDDVTLRQRQQMMFQMDGCPAHWGLAPRNWLNQNYPHRWIGRASLHDLNLAAWPPRSPDLTPLDFFLWGELKQKVYAQPVTSVEQLRERILAVCAQITPTMCRDAVTTGVTRRCHACLQVDGMHFEQLL